MKQFFSLLLVAVFCMYPLQTTAFAAQTEGDATVDPRTYLIGTPPDQEISGRPKAEKYDPPVTKENAAEYAAGPLREEVLDPYLQALAESEPLIRFLLPEGRSDAYREALYTVFFMLYAELSVSDILDYAESVYGQSDDILFLPRETDMWRFPMGTEFMVIVPPGAAKPAHDYSAADFSPTLEISVQYLGGFVIDETRPEDYDVLILQPAVGCSPAAFYRMLQASPYVMLCVTPEMQGKFKTERGDGDVDGDGEITVLDARLALRQAVGLERFAPDSGEFISADIDRNGVAEISDARQILRQAVGLARS